MLKFALKLTYVTGRRYNKTLMNYFFLQVTAEMLSSRVKTRLGTLKAVQDKILKVLNYWCWHFLVLPKPWATW